MANTSPAIEATTCQLSLEDSSTSSTVFPGPDTAIVASTFPGTLTIERSIIRGDITGVDLGVGILNSQVTGAVGLDGASFLTVRFSVLDDLTVDGTTSGLMVYTQLSSITKLGASVMNCLGNYSDTAAPIGC